MMGLATHGSAAQISRRIANHGNRSRMGWFGDDEPAEDCVIC